VTKTIQIIQIWHVCYNGSLKFDFLTFNKQLTLTHGSGRYAIAFDPSYFSKSGKKTPGLGWYWSGCANQVKWGLEIRGLAAIDIDNHTAFHLEAVQTINTDEQTLTDWYAGVISARKDTLGAISKYMVADACKLYFSTDVSMDTTDVLLYYQSRYQIVFLYRDGKQHTGLNDSRARSEKKLHFQSNASLTSINIAKVFID